MKHASALGIALAATSLLSPAAFAQDRVWTATGDHPYDKLGSLVSVVGDLNGDGVRDVAAQVPYGSASGYVRFLDGATGAKIHDVDGGSLGGYPMATRFADVDQDGVEDFFLRTSFLTPKVCVFSGATYAKLYQVPAQDYAVDVGDLDGDGIDDFVAYQLVQSTTLGEVRVFSGKSGALVRTIAPAGRSWVFGSWPVPAGDCDGDGVPDLAVEDNFQTLGTIVIVSLANGSILSQGGPQVGGIDKLAGIGDVDQDGRIDFALSTRYDTPSTLLFAGAVRVVSGATLTESGRLEGTQEWEQLHLADVVGDVDGDGFQDLGIATSGHLASSRRINPIWIHSGRTLRRLYAVQTEEHLGDDNLQACRGADLNGDGIDDLVVGRPGNSSNGVQAGATTVDRGRTAFLTVDPRLRPVAPLGSASAADRTFQALCADFAPATRVTLFLVEQDGAPTTPVPIGRGVVDALGEWNLSIPFDSPPPSSGARGGPAVWPSMLGVRAVGVDRNGAAVTTAIERFGYR